jgi:uncharacterized SAM-binding protein YcdF (DUF218 family)
MIVMVLFLLAVVAAGLLLFRRRLTGSLMGILALLLLLACGCGPVPVGLAERLQAGYSASTDVPWGERSVIILLGAGTGKARDHGEVDPAEFAYARILKAVELYGACKRHGASCTVLVSGGDPQKNGVTEAAIYAAVLRRAGVESADLVLDERSINTWQNAQFSKPLLDARHPDTEYLVTSGIHLHRAALYFARFGIHALPVRADYVQATYNPLPLTYNLLLTDVTLHEYIGIIRYYVYEKLGWNVASAGPGQP